MVNHIKNVEALLRETIREQTLRLEHLEQQLSEMKKLEAQRKTQQEQTSQAVTEVKQLHIQTQKNIGILHTQHDTYQTQTNESIRCIKMEQYEYHKRTDEAIDDLRNKTGHVGARQIPMPSEEGNLSVCIFLLFDSYFLYSAGRCVIP